MAQYSKMTTIQLQMLREQITNKIAAVDARQTGRDAEVDAAFADVKSDLERKLNSIDAEISSRS
jgi:hypothetical protein